MRYPERVEKNQIESEHQLLRLLVQGRVYEALMTSRNLEAKSGEYWEAVEGLTQGTEHEADFHKRCRTLLLKSLERQEAALRASRRLMESFSLGSRKRGMLAEVLSLIQVCIHRNALAQRAVMVYQAKALALQRGMPRDAPS